MVGFKALNRNKKLEESCVLRIAAVFKGIGRVLVLVLGALWGVCWCFCEIRGWVCTQQRRTVRFCDYFLDNKSINEVI